ncbi:MAG: hypothetical protein IPK12_01710 [Gemmatimonadetes bacterium]|nr:hypothetical protein [Gemmatimonadota bacterium]
MPLTPTDHDSPESPELRALAETLRGIRFAPRASLGPEIVMRLRGQPDPEPPAPGRGALLGLLAAGLLLGGFLFAFWRLLLSLAH